MCRAWLKALSILTLPVLWCSGCASSPRQVSVPITGGQTVNLERQGPGFKQAENDRVKISSAGLQAVNLNGNMYVRWAFSIRPKQARELSTIRVEDVTDPAPLLLINDVAPQPDGGQWTENGGLMELSSTNAHWLSKPNETVRIFRFTFNEPDGRSYLLYQGVRYSPAAKEAFRAMAR
jgi:hypothetical protein